MFKLPSYWYQQTNTSDLSFVVVPGFEPRQVSLDSSVAFLLVSVSISLSLLASLALITLSSSSSLLSFCHSLSLCLLIAHPLNLSPSFPPCLFLALQTEGGLLQLPIPLQPPIPPRAPLCNSSTDQSRSRHAQGSRVPTRSLLGALVPAALS